MANTEPPIAELVYLDTGEYVYLPVYDVDDNWLELGVCPTPRTVIDTIIYHIAHGALMHYPLWSILKFAWRNRRSFIEPQETVDAVDDSELTPIPTEYQLPPIDDTRKAQYISMTMVDSALLAADGGSDSLLLTMYGRDTLDVDTRFMQDDGGLDDG